MKKITIQTFGKIKEDAIEKLNSKYLSNINHYIKTEIKIHKDNANKPISITDIDFLNSKCIILSEKGKEYTSSEFSKLLSTKLENDDEIVFIIGNAFGFDTSIIDGNKNLLSLSQMTFTHEISLTLLLEQIYRGLNIRAGRSYHK
jgi:23S rRNA (pseudouridine1915-N3)-methyltransferase